MQNLEPQVLSKLHKTYHKLSDNPGCTMSLEKIIVATLTLIPKENSHFKSLTYDRVEV